MEEKAPTYPEINNRIISLDIETSGSNIQHGYRTLSIGLHHPHTGTTFYREVQLKEPFMVNPEASRIHKLPLHEFDQLTDVRVPANKLCNQAIKYLSETTGKARDRYFIPTGWNVGAFDMPYVRQDLEALGNKFQYRSLDLNALCFQKDVSEQRTLGATKKAIKKDCQPVIPHHALSDAIAASKALHLLTKREA